MKKPLPEAKVRDARPGVQGNQAKRERCQEHEDHPGDVMEESPHSLALPKGVTLGIRQLIHGDQNEINQPPDTTPAERHQFKDAQPDVSQIEAVHTEAPYEEGQKERHKPFFLLTFPEPDSTLNADFGRRYRLGPTGLAEAGTLHGPLTTGHTKLSIVGKLMRAVSAIHHSHLMIDKL